MAQNPYEQYLESSVMTASPLELIRMLYRCAIDSIEEARTHLASGDIAARAKPVSRASDALTELLVSLDHSKGGSISAGLADLYAYMQGRLLQAHCEQCDAMFAEVSNLLTTLLESWQTTDLFALSSAVSAGAGSTAPYGQGAEAETYVPISYSY
ncbi:MAG: flagellar export chaperone FliS [Bryobacteraceae bacterium]